MGTNTAGEHTASISLKAEAEVTFLSAKNSRTRDVNTKSWNSKQELPKLVTQRHVGVILGPYGPKLNRLKSFGEGTANHL